MQFLQAVRQGPAGGIERVKAAVIARAGIEEIQRMMGVADQKGPVAGRVQLGRPGFVGAGSGIVLCRHCP